MIHEYNRLAREFSFVTVDARQPIDELQGGLRRHISGYFECSKAATPTADAATVPTALRR